MATTVRVRDEDKASLDRLQARYLLATGERISLEELLGLVIDVAETHEDEFILPDEGPNLTPEEIERFLSGTSDWGVETSEEDIDRILYGGEDAA